MLKSFSIVTSVDIGYKVVILPDSSKFVTTPTWSAVPGYGWSQYSVGLNMASGWSTDNNYVVLKDGFAVGASKATAASVIVDDNPINAIYQNYDSNNSQVLAIIAQRLGTTDATCRASIDWLEIK